VDAGAIGFLLGTARGLKSSSAAVDSDPIPIPTGAASMLDPDLHLDGKGMSKDEGAGPLPHGNPGHGHGDEDGLRTAGGALGSTDSEIVAFGSAVHPSHQVGGDAVGDGCPCSARRTLVCRRLPPPPGCNMATAHVHLCVCGIAS
jgi:hypothetical protein